MQINSKIQLFVSPLILFPCLGNLTSPIEDKNSTVDYTCSSTPNVEDYKLEWAYKVHSLLPDEKEVTNENSYVEITLKEANAPGGANVVIGIVILVIVVLIGGWYHSWGKVILQRPSFDN